MSSQRVARTLILSLAAAAIAASGAMAAPATAFRARAVARTLDKQGFQATKEMPLLKPLPQTARPELRASDLRKLQGADPRIAPPAAAEDAAALPSAPELRGLFPNPASGPMRVSFALPAAAEVRAEFLDLAGRKVRSLAPRPYGPGSWTLAWDGRDGNGNALPAGIYWVRLFAGNTPAGCRQFALMR